MENRPKKKLLDVVRETIQRKHCSRRTEKSYVYWIKRYIFFHNVRHPQEMGSTEIEAFLTHLAVQEKVAAAHCINARTPLSSPRPVPVGEECGAASWALS
jgi:hypothetical protein